MVGRVEKGTKRCLDEKIAQWRRYLLLRDHEVVVGTR